MGVVSRLPCYECVSLLVVAYVDEAQAVDGGLYCRGSNLVGESDAHGVGRNGEVEVVPVLALAQVNRCGSCRGRSEALVGEKYFTHPVVQLVVAGSGGDVLQAACGTKSCRLGVYVCIAHDVLFQFSALVDGRCPFCRTAESLNPEAVNAWLQACDVLVCVECIA